MRVEVTTKQLLLYLWNYYRIYRDSFAEYIDESRRLFLLVQVARSCRHSVRAIRVVETGERRARVGRLKHNTGCVAPTFSVVVSFFFNFQPASQLVQSGWLLYVKDESWIRKLKCAVERWPGPTAFWASPISSSYTHCVEKVGNQLIARIIWWLTHFHV